MKRPVLAVCSVLAFAVLLLPEASRAQSGAPRAQGQKPATISFTEGDAWVLRAAGAKEAAKMSTNVYVGDEIQVLSNAYLTVDMPGTGVLRMMPRTHIRFPAGREPRKIGVVELLVGKTLLIIDAAVEIPFLVYNYDRPRPGAFKVECSVTGPKGREERGPQPVLADLDGARRIGRSAAGFLPPRLPLVEWGRGALAFAAGNRAQPTGQCMQLTEISRAIVEIGVDSTFGRASVTVIKKEANGAVTTKVVNDDRGLGDASQKAARDLDAADARAGAGTAAKAASPATPVPTPDDDLAQAKADADAIAAAAKKKRDKRKGKTEPPPPPDDRDPDPPVPPKVPTQAPQAKWEALKQQGQQAAANQAKQDALTKEVRLQLSGPSSVAPGGRISITVRVDASDELQLSDRVRVSVNHGQLDATQVQLSRSRVGLAIFTAPKDYAGPVTVTAQLAGSSASARRTINVTAADQPGTATSDQTPIPTTPAPQPLPNAPTSAPTPGNAGAPQTDPAEGGTLQLSFAVATGTFRIAPDFTLTGTLTVKLAPKATPQEFCTSESAGSTTYTLNGVFSPNTRAFHGSFTSRGDLTTRVNCTSPDEDTRTIMSFIYPLKFDYALQGEGRFSGTLRADGSMDWESQEAFTAADKLRSTVMSDSLSLSERGTWQRVR